MTLTEPSRQIPIAGNSDVVVAGAGPAGIAAALAAARAGARVRLLEVNGCVGGVWTAGLLAWLFEMDQPGITQELTAALDARGARHNLCTHDTKQYAYDVEAMKRLLEELLTDVGVEIHLHTRVVAVAKDQGRLTHVITESKSGRQAFSAEAFIDCSGDGDLAALAGCGFDLGKPDTGELQPATFMALITANDLDALKPYLVFQTGYVHDEFIGPTRAFLAELQSAGHDPSYHAPTLFHLRGNLLALMINHEYRMSAINEADVTRATLHGRAEVNRAVDLLRKRGGPWKDLLLVATPEQIGTREGRRIHGMYTVTIDDLIAGARHDDAVCRVSYQIDVHSTDPGKGKGFEDHRQKTQPYDIPLRSLIAKDAGNLLMAGRCISGDFLAHSSYRVTGVSVALGQSAGVAAALACSEGVTMPEVPHERVAAELKNVLTHC